MATTTNYKSFSISTDGEEVIRAKFNNTAMKIHGYLTEAHNDIQVDQDYSANAVYTRIKAISLAFEADIRSFGQSLNASVSNPNPYVDDKQQVMQSFGRSGYDKQIKQLGQSDIGRSGFSGYKDIDPTIRKILDADKKFESYLGDSNKWTMYNPVIDTIEAIIVIQDDCIHVIKGGHPDEVLTFAEFIKKYTNGN